MRRFVPFILIVVHPVIALADMGAYHADGLNHIKNLQEELKNTLGTFSLKNIPDFQTDSPREVGLNDHNMEAAATHQLHKDETALFIQESTIGGEKFVIDPKTDPAFLGMEETVQNPLKVISEDAKEEESDQDSVRFETKYCYESDEEGLHHCYKTLNVTVQIIPAQQILHWSCAGHRGRRRWFGWEWWYHCNDNPDCWSKENFWYTVTPETFTTSDSWTDNCDELEALIDKGEGNYVHHECVEPNQTRLINGKSITRSCWKEKYTYSRDYKSKDNCHKLRASGCFQIDSECIRKVEDRCVERRQTYSCPIQNLNANRTKISGSSIPYCLDGNCKDSHYEPNNEMLEALSRLYIFDEIQKEKKSFNISIFKGGRKKCRRDCAHFKDCCRKGKGWGIDIGFTSCNAEEKQLRTQREKKLCHQIGTYCHRREAGICVQKQTSFCCFPSKIARILQEQGRSQLGLSWGSAQKPVCRGFTVDELTGINFDHLDLSEIYEEILEKFKEKTPSIDGGKILENVKNRIENQLESVKKGGL